LYLSSSTNVYLDLRVTAKQLNNTIKTRDYSSPLGINSIYSIIDSLLLTALNIFVNVRVFKKFLSKIMRV
jgi:hypothetical protein